MNRCDQCGFAYGDLQITLIAGSVRSSAAGFRQVLSGVAPETAARRPDPAVWSALEYSCHVRDVLLVQRDRAVLALVEDRPSFARMYRDERVTLCRYNDQELEEVQHQLTMAAELCALVFDGISGFSWSRPLVYSWPAPAALDLAWLGRHTVHEIEHHRQDVIAGLRRVTGG